MAIISLTMLKTAVLGPVGIGAAGAAARCMECPWTKLDWGPCGGFGPGCLTREEERGKGKEEKR